MRSLAHLVEVVEGCTDDFWRFVGYDGTQIVVERKQSEKRGKQILRKFSVPHDRSPELRRPA